MPEALWIHEGVWLNPRPCSVGSMSGRGSGDCFPDPVTCILFLRSSTRASGIPQKRLRFFCGMGSTPISSL